MNLNSIIVEWAMDNGFGCAYCKHPTSRKACLRITLEHATAYFIKGSLDFLECRKDGKHTNELARELAVLFALCGHIDTLAEAIIAAHREAFGAHVENPLKEELPKNERRKVAFYTANDRN